MYYFAMLFSVCLVVVSGSVARSGEPVNTAGVLQSWQIQHDPAELPWKTGAAEQSTQWPPGGEPIIRVLDENTAVVICDTGMIPSGKLLPADYKPSREFRGRVQVRFFRRVPAPEAGLIPGPKVKGPQ